MADTEITVAIVEGDGSPIQGYAVQNGAGGPIATEVALRANSAVVGGDNPLDTADAAALAILQEIAASRTAAATVVSTSVTVGTASESIAAAGTMTRGWSAQNTTLTGAGYIDLCWGGTAVLGAGFYRLFPGSNQNSNGLPPPPSGTAMSAIASAAGQTLVITVFN